MTELFLNPWSMLAGALLVGVPILIHLINRIRYKRVRWAAMEFLLKAQKRIRRKLLLQQFLLLFLRCLLVFLVGLLCARLLDLGSLGSWFGVGESAQDNRTMMHVVLVDDTPSMADGWKTPSGQTMTAYTQAIEVLTTQIAPAASEATAPQMMEVVRLSTLDAPVDYERINATSIAAMGDDLKRAEPQSVHESLAVGLQRVKEIQASHTGDVGKMVHVLSDMRAIDWSVDGDAIRKELDELETAGVTVHFVDVVSPFRKVDERRSPIFHDNVAITQFQPTKLVVAKLDPLEFSLTVRNNGNTELKDVRFAIRVNGDENAGKSVNIPNMPANDERTIKFELPLTQTATSEEPLKRFNLVTAQLASGEPGGLGIDNVRHALVEVRDQLPILVLEGRPSLRDSKDGDGFYLHKLFDDVLAGYKWIDGTEKELESADLSNYVAIFILNQPTLSENAIRKLEEYTKRGGGVGFFMGPNIDAASYNALAYRSGEGLFPAPLLEQASPELSDEDLQARRTQIFQKKFLVRDEASKAHPALAGLYFDQMGEPSQDAKSIEQKFSFIAIERYWPISSVGKWRDNPDVTELYAMPNYRPMANYEAAIRDVADALPIKDPAMSKYAELLKPLQLNLRDLSVSSEPLGQLVTVLDKLLADQSGGEDEEQALLREFWAQPKMADLRTRTVRLRDTVKYGDPLYLAKTFGQGRVTLMTITAGETWSDWPSGLLGRITFPPIIKEMTNYLAGAGSDTNRSVGKGIQTRVDASEYKPTVQRFRLSHDPDSRNSEESKSVVTTGLEPGTMQAEQSKLVLNWGDDTDVPAAYVAVLDRLAADETTSKEYRGFVVNVDAAREGTLRRVARDDVQAIAPSAKLHSPDDTEWLDDLRNKQNDLSETPWLFLLLLLILMWEQALAVKMSYHTPRIS